MMGKSFRPSLIPNQIHLLAGQDLDYRVTNKDDGHSRTSHINNTRASLNYEKKLVGANAEINENANSGNLLILYG